MDLSYYSFAFFVFLLVCACIWLFGKVVRGGKKDEKSDYDKEQRLFKLYQNMEDMMISFEEYVEEVKTEFDQKTLQISGMLEKMGGISNAIETEKNEKKAEPKSPQKQRSSAAQTKTKIKTEEKIARLIDEGMDKSEIAKKLGISSRQVSLIMQIKGVKKNS